MLKTSIFKIQVNCPGCNMFHTVTSISDREICQNCGKYINLENFFRSQILGGADTIKYMNAFLSGSVERMGGSGGVENVGSYKLSYSSSQPYCEECLEFIEEPDLMAAIKSEKPIKCGKCSHAMPVRQADSEIKDFHPKAIAVINDTKGVDESEKKADKESMLVFACMSCGAGLQLNKDTGRTIKCNYCSNENYLPDVIWTKLHPNKEVSPLFVILDLDGADFRDSVNYFLNVTMARIYEKQFENFIREYFEKPFVNDAVNSWFSNFLSAKNDESGFNIDIEKLQKSFYSQINLGYETHNLRLREITAGYGCKIPIELQNRIVKDADDNVRLALAGNTSIHKDILKMLQNDKSPQVSTEAKKHKTGLFKGLFG